MRWSTTVFLTGVAWAVAIAAAPATTSQAESPSPTPWLSVVAPPNYTFQLDVLVRMQHFPWLRFHLLGTGEYEPGETYKVTFTKVPWLFPKSLNGIDLSMLDPLMWPGRFLYEQTGIRDGMTLFSLHALNDPALAAATVALGPRWRARTVDADFTNGSHIHMSITPSAVDGFLLPETLSADIEEPHLSVSASGDFKDYTFEPTE
ncbi:MAG: hypothetical protein WAK16_09130 [Candidatus Cybelea sp.]|jgi:hypothetical protein